MRFVAIAMVIVLALAVAGPPGVTAQQACNKGFVEYVCPNENPVCCSWPENGVLAACCPPLFSCDLDQGVCIKPINQSVIPSVTGSAPQSKGVTVGVSEAAAFITFTAIGFIVALVMCAFVGFRVFLSCAECRRRRREAERQRLLNGGSSSDGESDKESDVDETGQCTLCFAHSINCVLLPCAHVCTCKHCATRLEQCPICRKDVVKYVTFKTPLYLKGQRGSNGPSPANGTGDDAAAEVVATARSDRTTEMVDSPRTARAPVHASSNAPPVPPAAVVELDDSRVSDSVVAPSHTVHAAAESAPVATVADHTIQLAEAPVAISAATAPLTEPQTLPPANSTATPEQEVEAEEFGPSVTNPSSQAVAVEEGSDAIVTQPPVDVPPPQPASE